MVGTSISATVTCPSIGEVLMRHQGNWRQPGKKRKSTVESLKWETAEIKVAINLAAEADLRGCTRGACTVQELPPCPQSFPPLPSKPLTYCCEDLTALT